MLLKLRSIDQPVASIALIVLLFAVQSSGSYAQEPQHWRFWKILDDPTMSKTISWSSFGSSGKVWFVHSFDPVIRFSWFDGYHFGSLPVTGPYSIIREGASGQIWAVNYDITTQRVVSVSRYNNYHDRSDGEWIHYAVPELELAGLTSMTITELGNFLPSGGDCLLLLLPDWLVEFDAISQKTAVLIKAEETDLGKLIQMTEAQDGGLWITAEKGFGYAYGRNPGELPTSAAVQIENYVCPETLYLHDFACPMPNDNSEILCSATSVETSRRVLVGFDRKNWRIVYAPENAEVAMGWAGADDTLWILKAQSIRNPRSWFGSSLSSLNWITPSLVWLRNGQEHSVEQKNMLTSLFQCVAAKPFSEFWLGLSGGAARYAPPTWRTPPGCPEIEGRVYAACEDQQGRLWFSAMDTLLCFEGHQWKIIRLPEGKNFPIYTVQFLCSMADGRIATITTDGDLLTFKPGNESDGFHSMQHPLGRKFRLIVPTKDGQLWVNTADGTTPGSRLYIELYDGERFQTILGENEDLGLGIVCKRLLETSGGELWIAGGEGFGRYANGLYHKFDFGDDSQRMSIFSLLELEDGRIWGGGISQIIEFQGTSWRIVSRGELGSGGVNVFLQRHDGSLWATSSEGIYRHIAGSWIANTEEDGLPSAHGYALFEDSRNRLWAGTSNGLSLYHPETDPDPPETYIPEGKNLTETSPGGNVRIEYAGMDRWNYTQTERLLYSHRFDRGPWSKFAADTVASATGLTAGDHTFEVRAIDRNWNIDSIPASFTFMVPLPWYREPAFLVLSVLGTVMIVLLGSYSISRYFYLEQLVASRTKELQEDKKQLRSLASELSLAEERERRRLATDLHDSISQSLTISMMELSAMDQAQTVDELKAQAGIIRERLDEAFQVTQNLTFDLCPPELYQVGLESAIRELAGRIKRQYSLEIAFDCDEKPKPLPDDVRHFLFRATRELLFNVVKHANASAVRIRIRRNNTDIQIQVSDDGQGFALTENCIDANKRGAFGLFSIRERVSQIGGSLKIESNPGQGTTVSIVAPLSHEDVENGTQLT